MCTWGYKDVAPTELAFFCATGYKDFAPTELKMGS